ncbi:MAG: acyl carrier protein [Oscillospiraceae bacterium]|jgi:acyl carrier protein|nr:acyl carrier protein [Oscillospiraceae bacterium]MBR2782014.1 acyl carrier protein [Oscillospiraceae bacterium]
MFEKIAAYIAEQLAISVDEITPESTFDELGIDSLDTVEMIMELENALNISLDLDDQKISNVGEFAAFVESKMD